MKKYLFFILICSIFGLVAGCTGAKEKALTSKVDSLRTEVISKEMTICFLTIDKIQLQNQLNKEHKKNKALEDSLFLIGLNVGELSYEMVKARKRGREFVENLVSQKNSYFKKQTP